MRATSLLTVAFGTAVVTAQYAPAPSLNLTGEPQNAPPPRNLTEELRECVAGLPTNGKNQTKMMVFPRAVAKQTMYQCQSARINEKVDREGQPIVNLDACCADIRPGHRAWRPQRLRLDTAIHVAAGDFTFEKTRSSYPFSKSNCHRCGLTRSGYEGMENYALLRCLCIGTPVHPDQGGVPGEFTPHQKYIWLTDAEPDREFVVKGSPWVAPDGSLHAGDPVLWDEIHDAIKREAERKEKERQRMEKERKEREEKERKKKEIEEEWNRKDDEWEKQREERKKQREEWRKKKGKIKNPEHEGLEDGKPKHDEPKDDEPKDDEPKDDAPKDDKHPEVEDPTEKDDDMLEKQRGWPW